MQLAAAAGVPVAELVVGQPLAVAVEAEERVGAGDVMRTRMTTTTAMTRLLLEVAAAVDHEALVDRGVREAGPRGVHGPMALLKPLPQRGEGGLVSPELSGTPTDLLRNGRCRGR